MDGNEELFSLSTLVSGVCSVTSTHDTGNPSNQLFEQQNKSSMDGSRDIKKERDSSDMIENSSANIKQSLTSNSSAVDQPCGNWSSQQRMDDGEGLIDINNIKQEPEDDYKTDNYPTTTSNSCVDNDSAQDMQSSYTDLGDSSCVICVQCNKWFDCMNDLKTHDQIVHRGERPFQCQDCSIAFTDKKSLNRHKKLHQSEKFVRKASPRNTTRRPITTSRTLSKDKRFKCNKCEKEFSSKTSLNNHQKIHLRSAEMSKNNNQQTNQFEMESQVSQQLQEANNNLQQQQYLQEESQLRKQSKGAISQQQKSPEHQQKQHDSAEGKPPDKSIVLQLFLCKECRIWFNDFSALESHYLRVHKGEKSLQQHVLPNTALTLNNKQLLQVNQQNSKEKEHQPQPHQRIGKEDTNKQHHQPQQQYPLYQRQQERQQHPQQQQQLLQIHHQQSLQQQQQPAATGPKEKIYHSNSTVELFVCRECNKWFSCQLTLENHNLTVHKGEKYLQRHVMTNPLNGSGNKQSHTQQLNPEKSSEKERRKPEALSGSKQRSPIADTKHMNTFFLCRECNVWFSGTLTLGMHHASMHWGEKRGEQTFQMKTLNGNFVRVQSNEKEKQQQKKDIKSQNRQQDSLSKEQIIAIVVTASDSAENPENSSHCLKRIEFFLCKQCNKWLSSRKNLQCHKERAHEKENHREQQRQQENCQQEQQQEYECSSEELQHQCDSTKQKQCQLQDNSNEEKQNENKEQSHNQQDENNEQQQVSEQKVDNLEQQYKPGDSKKQHASNNEQQQSTNVERQHEVSKEQQQGDSEQDKQQLCESKEKKQEYESIKQQLQQQGDNQGEQLQQDGSQEYKQQGREHIIEQATQSSLDNPQDIASILSLCTVCSIWYSTRKELKNHQDTKHKRSIYKFTGENNHKEVNHQNLNPVNSTSGSSSQANKQIKRKNEVEEHPEIKHQRLNPSTSQPSGMNGQHEDEQENANTVRCNTSTSYQNPLQSTLKIVFKCVICELCFTNSHDLDCHNKRHVERPYNCTKCAKRFAEKSLLENHLNEWHKPFTCSSCQEHFFSEDSLESHAQTHQEDYCQDVFKCGTCLKGFKSISLLKVHFQSRDTFNTTPRTLRECQLKCQICYQEFEKRRDFFEHLPEHRKNTDYKCHLCGEEFEDNYLLKRHCQEKHNDTKIYKCSVCSEAYSTKFKLKRHFVNHSDNKSQCPICNKVFIRPFSLTNHAMVHTGEKTSNEKPHECTVCGKTFIYKSYLKLHSVSHNKEKAFKCTVCGEAFNYKVSLMRHVYRHTGEKPFKCTVCDKAFKRKTSLDAHGYTHNGGKPYNCSFCGKTFSYKFSLKCHIDRHNGKEPQKPYKCSHCDETFKHKVCLDFHLDKHAGRAHYQCTVCSKTFTNQNTFQRHSDLHSSKNLFECTVCSKAFTSKNNLKIHSFKHSREKQYKCALCNAPFRYKVSLEYHLNKHDGVEPYQCTICSKTFTHQTTFKRHRHLHGKEKEVTPCCNVKPFQCTVCKKAFKCEKNLITHRSKHTGEKPFKCEICSETFAHKISLTNHSYKHSGERPHKCSTCSKGFTTKSTLTYHLKSHDPERYTCTLCEEKFPKRALLNKHKVEHNGKKEYKCPICSKVFNKGCNMQRHYTMHSGIKPFKCSVCGKKYFEKADLKSHCLKIHMKWNESVKKEHACPICNKVFARNDIMKRHYRLHSGIKMFKCTVCEKQYWKKSDLKKHCLKIHEKWSEELIVKQPSNFDVKEISASPTQSSDPHKTMIQKDSDNNQVLKVTVEKGKTALNGSHTSQVPEATARKRITPLNSENSQVPEVTTGKHKTPLNSENQVPEITAEKEKLNHKKAGPFESKFCKGCKTWFGRQSKFENHSHKNERRFKCKDCERMFMHSNAFKMHQQTHVK